MSIRFAAALIGLTLLGAGCGPNIQAGITATTTALAISSTLPASPLPTVSETPPLPIAQPSLTPVEGITSTQVNVRAEPSTAGNILGVIPADMRVEITGKDPGGTWWQINYPQGAPGKGWVTAQYITLPSAAEVPVIGGAETVPANGNVAVIQQQINVRSGPGTDFNSLGTLNPQDVVRLTGKDPDGAWLQIDFPQGAGPDGKGWVNAAFVQAQGTENLPIVAESGQVVGTGTPTGIPPTPTVTLVPAWDDGDSAGNPIASVIFEPNGTQAFLYNGDVSAPEGDAEDWIVFRPEKQIVFVSLECKGSDAIEVQLLENSSPIDTHIRCGAGGETVAVKPGSSYMLHVKAGASAALQYTNYVLTIKTRR